VVVPMEGDGWPPSRVRAREVVMVFLRVVRGGGGHVSPPGCVRGVVGANRGWWAGKPSVSCTRGGGCKRRVVVGTLAAAAAAVVVVVVSIGVG
jgi:hypothetical protein